MVVQDLFDELATGEFSNIALGNSVNGSIEPSSYKKIITQLNAGLRELYKRFLLKQKTCYITRPAGTTDYFLRDAGTEEVPAMWDTTMSAVWTTVMQDPFGNLPITSGLITVSTEVAYEDPTVSDLCKVIGVFDKLGVTDVYLNDKRHPDSVFTKKFDHISIKDPLPVTLGIVYQAYYPKIVLDEDFDPETYELFFPDFITYALKCYIASELYTGKTSKATEGATQVYNTFHAKFEKACKIIELNGFAEEENDDDDTRFDNGGWV